MTDSTPHDEYERLVAQHRKHPLEEEAEEIRNSSALIDTFKRHASSKGIEGTDLKFQYSPRLGLTASSPNLLRSLLRAAP